jgi:hypothetical protein
MDMLVQHALHPPVRKCPRAGRMRSFFLNQEICHMAPTPLLHGLRNILRSCRFHRRSGRIKKPVIRRRSLVPLLEAFEERTLPSVFTVMNLNDSGPGSLRAAIASANANPGPDAIVFSGGLHGTITLTSGELLITDSVSIAGPGSGRLTVSGNNASRVFDMAPALSVAINDLTIARGHALDQAGGILNQGSDLRLARDVLSNNVVVESATDGARGGGIYSAAGTLNLVNCQVTGNQALGGCGASYYGLAIGGGMYVLGGNVTITNSTIAGNLAQGGNASGDGVGQGGGISLESDALGLVLSNSTIDSNRAIGGSNDSSGGYGDGGGIAASAAISLINSTISNNSAVGGNGGTGAYVGDGFGGGLNVDSTTITISGSTFVNNKGIGGSGGKSGSGNVDSFMDYGFSGAMNTEYEATLNVSNTNFIRNEALGGNNGVATASDIAAAGGAEGGAILNEVGMVATFTGCTFDQDEAIGGNGNTACAPMGLVGEGLGGAIDSGYGGSDVGANTITLCNCLVSGNNAQGGNNNSGTASVAGLVGVGAGAGLANYAGGSAYVSNSTVSLNVASGGRTNTTSGSGALLANLGAGGGIFNYLSNFNSAGYGQLDVSVVNVSDSLIALNEAQASGCGEGGGIADALSASTTVMHSTLTLNEAHGRQALGGGAYNDATSSLGLTKSLVTLNLASGSQGCGGGVYNVGTLTYDAFTIILFNLASTHGNNIGP